MSVDEKIRRKEQELKELLHHEFSKCKENKKGKNIKIDLKKVKFRL